MSSTGVEKKPPWRDVPAEVRQLIGEELGSPVVRGTRVWGSYGPGPSFRLLLENGKLAFVKALWPESNSFQVDAFSTELSNYRELAHLIKPWAPELLGEIKHGEWHALLLEDVGPKTAPPWRRSDVRRVAQKLARFHSENINADFPDDLATLDELGVLRANVWRRTDVDSDLEKISSLSTEPHTGLKWLKANLAALKEVSERSVNPQAAHTLLHVDTRSDNLRIVDRKLRLFDWPFACRGPRELDAVGFAQTVEAEGGPVVKQVLSWYQEIAGLDGELVTAFAAALSGFFADRSWQPGVPELPRIRTWQRAQFKVTLKLASGLIGLEPPAWVDGIQ